MNMRIGCGIVALVLAGASQASAIDPVRPEAAREAAERSVRLLDKTTGQWQFPCLSCHHQGLALMALNSARVHGLTVDEAVQQKHGSRTFRMLSQFDGLVTMPMDTLAMGYALAGGDGMLRRTATTDLLARKIADFQAPGGYWGVNDARPPHSDSVVTATALMVRALARYAPPEMEDVRDAALARARRWLVKSVPVSNEDGALRLLGLRWSGASKAALLQSGGDVLRTQNPDGGWSQMPGMQSDAYATGQSIAALLSANVVPAEHAAIRNAVS